MQISLETVSFTFEIRFRYVLGERRTFVYHNPDPREIVYYLGQKISIPGEGLATAFPQNVTLVCFDDYESAIRVVKRSEIYRHRSCRHIMALRAKDYTYDAGIDKHLVCFERFDGFLPQADPAFLASLEDPNSSFHVPGNPKEIVQQEVRALSEALEDMHSNGVSSSSLHLTIGYVWCHSLRMLRMIMLDVENREDHTSVQWNKIQARNALRFGTGLDNYFLNTTVDWPEKDSFMRCFSMRLQEENKRLPIVCHHPFLINNNWEKFRTLFTLYHQLKSNHPSDDDALRFTKLRAALHSQQFKSEFMPNGEWTRQDMSPEFEEFLRGEPRGNSYKYNTNDMGDLVRFLWNMYEHGSEEGISLEFMYNEVGRYWPHLVDRIHEKIAAGSGRRRFRCCV